MHFSKRVPRPLDTAEMAAAFNTHRGTELEPPHESIMPFEITSLEPFAIMSLGVV
jgi:hypothetical protein